MKKILSLFMGCIVSLTISAQSTSNSQSQTTRNSPYVLYDYLKVFPDDLGTFESVPTSIIDQLNSTSLYGYNTWRIPTEEELSLMVANKVIANASDYMSSNSHSSGKVRLVTDKETAEAEAAREKAELQKKIEDARAQGYVYLGLPSGTLWKDKNEEGGLYTYDQAKEKFNSKLPTEKQFLELRESCQWTWIGDAYKVTGPSGEYIILTVEGHYYCWDGLNNISLGGDYWTSSLNPNYPEANASGITFDDKKIVFCYYHFCDRLAVRLVQ